MKKINRKHMVPRFTAKKTWLPRRGPFLSTNPALQWKTFFGPGQPPDAIEDPYAPPSDWPKESTLLRVPQIVWLSSYFMDNVIREYNLEIGESTTNSYSDPGYSGATWNYDHPDIMPAYSSTTTGNHVQAEYDRLLALFATVKDRIERIRPGRTWVQVPMWRDPAIAWADDQFLLASHPYLHLISPQVADEPDYFGTNFFHVWCGDPQIDHDYGEPGTPELGRLTFGLDWPTTSLADDTSHQENILRLQQACDWFAGYRVAIYTYEASATIPSFDSPLAPCEDGSTVDPVWNPAWGYEGSADLRIYEHASNAAAYNRTITHLNGSVAYFAALSTSWYAESCALIDPDYRVAVEGDSSDLTEDSLVTLIADHYGFDPDTGANLE